MASLLVTPHTNRGRRFTMAERDARSLHGFVHPRGPRSMSDEVARVLAAVNGCDGALRKYEMLLNLLARDEALFFATAQRALVQVLPCIYTPAVGDACLSYSSLMVPSRGLWIGIDRAGQVRELLDNWVGDVDVVVVSDCERILGLGDLGANGHGIPVGKLLLYSACGGVDPARCLPVTLDVGCNTASVREDPNYIGLDIDRVRGEQYDAFVEEFIVAVVDRFGKNCLIQFEDFANANALRLLNKYRDRVCCFNDDIQGTAAVGLSGILTALRIEGVKPRIHDHVFLFLGAGSAGIGIASLIVLALVRAGVPEADARRQCWFIDSHGLVYAGRESISDAKAPFAHEAPEPIKAVAASGLHALVKALRPTGLIGVSTIKGSFNDAVLKEMAIHNERPIIFALSNPTSKAECTAEDAYRCTGGNAIFASGSPFAPVTLPGRDTPLVPGQGNNSYIFPGLGLGVVVSGARRVPDSMLLVAADTVASLVDESQLAVSCVYPPLDTLLDISAHIALAVCKEAEELGLSDKPVDHVDLKAIRRVMYTPGASEM